MATWRKYLSLLLVSGLIWGASTYCLAANDNLQEQIKQTNQKLKKVRNKERSVMGNLLQNQKEMDAISTNLEKLNNQVGTTEQKMQAINIELHKSQAGVEKVRGDIQGRKKILNSRLVSIYKYGYQSYLEALFRVDNFSEMVSRFEMVGSFVRNDMQMLRTLQEQHDYITQKNSEIAMYHEELGRQKRIYNRLKAEAMKQHTRLASKVVTQKKELSSIQNDREKLEDSLDELNQQSKALETEIRNDKNQSRVALGTGSFIWPVHGKIASPYGYRLHPILKKVKYHSGLDISVSRGTPILAADSGIVMVSKYNGGYGKMIILDHGAGLTTVYGHASALLVTVGQKVVKGQKIALVGSTGLSTGPHLHFEVRKAGAPRNPLRYL